MDYPVNRFLRRARCNAYEQRFYRDWVAEEALWRFEIKVKESDLLILCDRDLRSLAEQVLKKNRSDIERYASAHPDFFSALAPLPISADAPAIVQQMGFAAQCWDVGPMAAVAGAVASAVGEALVRECQTVIVENGGDIFAQAPRPLTFAIYAGEGSPFADKICFHCEAHAGLGVCTSSATVGPSLSFGAADAVVAIAGDAAMADAAATALANQIKRPGDVDWVVAEQSRKAELNGLIAICGDRFGAFGSMEFQRRKTNGRNKRDNR